MRRWAIGCASAAFLAVLTAALLVGLHFLVECRDGKVTECNYKKIKAGMTVKQAEAILGPGQDSPMQYVPEARGGHLVVSGDRFFRWADDSSAPGSVASREVWVGVRDGRICSKWYRELSL